MSDALQLLWPPFLVALCMLGIHVYFGIEVLRRKVIFVDLALAQIAALGTTVAFMLGHSMQGTPRMSIRSPSRSRPRCCSPSRGGCPRACRRRR